MKIGKLRYDDERNRDNNSFQTYCLLRISEFIPNTNTRGNAHRVRTNSGPRCPSRVVLDAPVHGLISVGTSTMELGGSIPADLGIDDGRVDTGVLGRAGSVRDSRMRPGRRSSDPGRARGQGRSGGCALPGALGEALAQGTHEHGGARRDEGSDRSFRTSCTMRRWVQPLMPLSMFCACAGASPSRDRLDGASARWDGRLHAQGTLLGRPTPVVGLEPDAGRDLSEGQVVPGAPGGDRSRRDGPSP